MTLGSIITPSHEAKFNLRSSRLLCPIHDDMQFRYFCRQDQEFVCDYCMIERHHEHDMEDLNTRCEELRGQFLKQLSHTKSALNQVKVKKSMLKSGKHIDAFFDTLIKDILVLHQSVKEQYRAAQEEYVSPRSVSSSDITQQSPLKYGVSPQVAMTHKHAVKGSSFQQMA